MRGGAGEQVGLRELVAGELHIAELTSSSLLLDLLAILAPQLVAIHADLVDQSADLRNDGLDELLDTIEDLLGAGLQATHRSLQNRIGVDLSARSECADGRLNQALIGSHISIGSLDLRFQQEERHPIDTLSERQMGHLINVVAIHETSTGFRERHNGRQINHSRKYLL